MWPGRRTSRVWFRTDLATVILVRWCGRAAVCCAPARRRSPMSPSSGIRPVAPSVSRIRRSAYLIAIALVAPLVALPLGWQEQALLSAAFIAAAALLNLTSRARTVTCALIVVSIFSTIRYGYFRVAQTWDGLTSAGHLY